MGGGEKQAKNKTTKKLKDSHIHEKKGVIVLIQTAIYVHKEFH